jgi:hypothetical protein
MKLGHGHPQRQVLLEWLFLTIPCVHRKMVYLVTSITFLLGECRLLDACL